MNILRNIELSFVNHLENKKPINDIEKAIKTFFDIKKINSNIENQQQNKYISMFENERIKNNIEYDIYLQKLSEYKDLWKKTKSQAVLHDMLKLLRPKNDVPDIYTYSVININEPKERPKLPKEQIKPVIKPKIVKKEKECPPGKVLNPLTGRCVAIKEPKPVKKAK